MATNTTTRMPVATVDDRAYLTKCHESVHRRVIVERAILRRTIAALLAAGYAITVDNGYDSLADCEVIKSTDATVIMDGCMAADEDRLHLYWKLPNEQWRHDGWVYLVYGNAGYEAIADYTVNLDPVLKPVNDYADQLAEVY